MKGLYGGVLILLFTLTASAQTFTSVADGPWNQASTWDQGDVPNASNSSAIIIQHAVNIPNGVSVSADQITIDPFAGLTVDAGGTLTLVDDGTGTEDLTVYNDGFDYGFLTVNGTFILANQAAVAGTDGINAVFNAGSIYRHQYTTSEGSIPIAFWDENSTVIIEGYTGNINATVNGNWNQTFGNVVFNCAGLGNNIIQLNGLLTTIQNDLTVSATGNTGGSLRFATTQNPTIIIGRDLIVSGTARMLVATGTNTVVNIGRDFLYSSSNTSGTNLTTTGNTSVNVGRNLQLNANGGRLVFSSTGSATVTVTGDVEILAGTLMFGSTSTGTGVLNVFGNLSNNGIIDELSSSPQAGSINFVGAGTHLYTNTGAINNSINFSVASLSTLDLGTSVVSGSGNFTLNGTLRLGSLDPSGALQTGATGGNIQVTGTRTWASNSNIVYSGAGAQFIGNGFPSGGDVNLFIDNPSGVTLSTSLDIVALRQLNLVSGNIVIGTQTLTINGTVAGNGGIIGGPTAKLVIGGTGDFGTLTFNGTSELEDLTINRTGSGQITLGGNLRILDTFTHSEGTLVVGANTLRISGDYVVTNGILSVTDQSAILIDGEGSLPTDVSLDGSDLGTLTLNRAGATLPITSSVAVHNLELFGGTLDNGSGLSIAGGGTIYRSAGGSMTNSPNNTTTAYNVVYNNGTMTTGPELPSNTTALLNLSKAGGGTLTLGSDITVNGTLTFTNGSFDAANHILDLKGNFVTNATSILTNAQVTFSGTTLISGSTAPTFGNVVISGTVTPNVNYRINGNITNSGTLNAGTGSVTFGGTTVISGGSNSFNNVTILGSSSLTAPASGLISVAGNFVNSGTFTHNSGTVVFNGTSSISGSTLFNNVTVQGTLNAPSNLRLAGNLNVNGTFNANSGNITFEGTGAQRLDRTSGSGTAIIDLYNVTINKPSNTFSVASTIPGTVFRVANQFEIVQNGTSGTDVDFDGPSNDGTLVLRSTDQRTAIIAAVPSGTAVTGNITVERYIPNGSGTRTYRYFAPPVAGSTVADWQQEIAITGQFSDASTGVGNQNTPSMYRYEETMGGVWNNRYLPYPDNIALPASSFPLESGRGYAVYMYSTGTPTLSTRGTLRTGDVNITLTATGSEPDAAGFNLVGNPYPAPIDWDLVSIPGGVSSTISLKDNVDNAGAGAGNFVYYVQGGPNVGAFTGVIASGQAFWVESTVNTTLTFSEANKASVSNPVVVREKALANVLRIHLNGNNRHDESVIWLQEEATDGVDLRFDARKKINDHLNLYTLFEGSNARYAINGLKDFGCSRTFKLGISDINADSANVVTPGSYTLSFSELETFTTPYEFLLVDKFRNEVVNLRNQAVYSFDITSDPKTFGEDRFELVVSQPTFARDNVLNFEDVCSNAGASITIEGSNPSVSYFVKDVQGQAISEVVKGNGNALVLTVPAAKLTEGLNKLMVYAQSGACEALPLENTIDLRVDPIYNEFDVETVNSCGVGSATLTASGLSQEASYYWYDTELSTEPVAIGSVFQTPVLEKSKTYFVAARNVLGCEGQRIEVKAEVKQAEPAVISLVEGGVLTTNYTGNLQWYLDDEPIEGATNQELLPVQSGTYKVVVDAGGCQTSAYYEFSVTGIEERLGANVAVYPNPTKDRVVVELRNLDPAVSVLMNNMGQTVGTAEFSVQNGVQSAEFDLTNASAGVYLLRIRQGAQNVYLRIVKQ